MKRFKIHVRSDISYVEEPLPSKVISQINKVTSYELPGAWVSGFSPQRRYLFSRATQKFPSGLLKRVKKSIRKCGYKTRTIDYRKQVKIDDKKILSIFDNLDFSLRDYQAESVVDGVRYQHGLFWHPTGSGKTKLFTLLLLCYDKVTLVITHRKELLYQTKREIEQLTGREVGIIGDGNWAPRKWTVGLVNSFMRKDDLLKNVITYLEKIEYLICDEVHHLGASMWWKIAKQSRNTVARHGFSGTCFRTDNADLLLLAHTGDVISHYTSSYMIENGWLARPLIYRDKIKYSNGVSSNSTWNQVEKELIVNNPERNRKGCRFIYDSYSEGGQILILIKRIDHGHIIKNMLQQDFGVEARDIRYMSGRESTEVREKALLDFKYGVYPILIGTSIYDEGIDLPTIGTGVNLSGGDSDIKTVQRLGRVIRKVVPDGELDVDPSVEQNVKYYDPFDTGHRFVKKHSKNRQKVYESEKAFLLKGEYSDEE